MSKFKIEKDYHRRKLAIIEMIEQCSDYIKRERQFIKSISGYHSGNLYAISISNKNIKRYQNISDYLTSRYNKN